MTSFSMTSCALAAALATAIMSTPAQAEESDGPAIFRKGATLMSLFETGKTETPAMRQAYLGQAPYVCSPSGYGHIASCVRRETVASAD